MFELQNEEQMLEAVNCNGNFDTEHCIIIDIPINTCIHCDADHWYDFIP